MARTFPFILHPCEGGIMAAVSGEGHAAFEHVHEDAPHDRPPINIQQLAGKWRERADQLGSDGATRGDMKLLSPALKDLRYCLKVFTPFRNVRKVTVFGSARLPSTDPAFGQAVEFGRRMAEAGYMVITGA